MKAYEVIPLNLKGVFVKRDKNGEIVEIREPANGEFYTLREFYGLIVDLYEFVTEDQFTS